MKEQLSQFMKYDKEFNNIFGRGLHINNFIDRMLLMVGMTSFDIVAFDERMKILHSDYKEGEESLKQFIERKYGKSARKLIEELLKLPKIKKTDETNS